jgi:hypothetical protein
MPEDTEGLTTGILVLLLSMVHFRMWMAALRTPGNGMMKFAHAKLAVKP